ncbi:family 5 glycoside hydrolase [Melampsora americana]|nr:family 5 glycoside hydrolase [Melampsora americana]
MSNRYSNIDPNGRPAQSTKPTKKWTWISIAIVLALCAIVIPIAVVLSTRDHSDSRAAVRSSTSTNKNLSNSTTNGLKLAPKKKWNFSTDKMIGLNLGNWLILERWMNEDWFTENAGANSWDEWDFTTVLGSKAVDVLEEHWNTWITEADVERAYQAGINTFRVPVPFWMWIPTTGSEPYLAGRQMAHFERLCSYAYARDMYIIIDLHGLPGSQNGEQQSGRNTTSPTFWQPLQQARSDQTVKAVVDWLAQSPYASIISAIEAVNEPRPYTPSQLAMLRSYYDRSYKTIQTLGPNAPAMMFADGFVKGDKFSYWYDFAKSHQTDPPSLIFTDHPYPGYFPAQNNTKDIFNQTCTDAAKYINFPVPTAITEWSLRTGIQNSTFEQEYYSYQLTAWTWFAGSCFWSIRALDSKISVLADPVAQYQWSFESLLARGSIPTPKINGSKDTKAITTKFITDLGTPCGPAPTLNSGAEIPQTAAATAAVTAAQEAKAMIPQLEADELAAAKSFGLAGIGSDAVMVSAKTK